MSDSQPERDPESLVRGWVVAVLERECEVQASLHPRGKGGHVMDAMNALCARLGADLQRWLGGSGWHTLLARAVARTTRSTPVPWPLALGADGELHWSDAATLRTLASRVCVDVLVAIASALERFIGSALTWQVMQRALAAGSEEGIDHA